MMDALAAANRFQTVDRFVKEAERQGYRIAYQASWPNGAGWIAMSDPRANHRRIELLVKFYPNGKFTTERLSALPQVA